LQLNCSLLIGRLQFDLPGFQQLTYFISPPLYYRPFLHRTLQRFINSQYRHTLSTNPVIIGFFYLKIDIV